MIEVNKLTKWYGPTLAVDRISFTVSPGEIIGFIGPNGAGKTTTMKILTTFVHASEGTATVAGFDVRESPLEVRRRIGYLAEHNPLYVDMKVREYLSFIADLRNMAAADRSAGIERVVKSCGLAEVFEREIRELSKGYRQRVGLAQAMVHNPDYLILDEPTSGLDPNQIVEVRSLIKEIGKEKTVILSTHTLVEVALTCQRILVIHKGGIVAEGTLDALRQKADLPDRASIAFQGDVSGMEEALSKVPGVIDALKLAPDAGFEKFDLRLSTGACIEEGLFKLARDRSLSVGSFEVARTTLEEVFNALTVGGGATVGGGP